MIRRSHTLRDRTDKSGSVINGHWSVTPGAYSVCTSRYPTRAAAYNGGAEIDSLIDRERFCVTGAYLEDWNRPKEASYTSRQRSDTTRCSVRTHRGIYEIW